MSAQNKTCEFSAAQTLSLCAGRNHLPPATGFRRINDREVIYELFEFNIARYCCASGEVVVDNLDTSIIAITYIGMYARSEASCPEFRTNPWR